MSTSQRRPGSTATRPSTCRGPRRPFARVRDRAARRPKSPGSGLVHRPGDPLDVHRQDVPQARLGVHMRLRQPCCASSNATTTVTDRTARCARPLPHGHPPVTTNRDRQDPATRPPRRPPPRVSAGGVTCSELSDPHRRRGSAAPRGQQRLEDRRDVDRALGGTGTHPGVQPVDEQVDVTACGSP